MACAGHGRMQRGRGIARPVIRWRADDVGARATFAHLLLTFSTQFALLSHHQASDPLRAAASVIVFDGRASEPLSNITYAASRSPCAGEQAFSFATESCSMKLLAPSLSFSSDKDRLVTNIALSKDRFSPSSCRCGTKDASVPLFPVLIEHQANINIGRVEFFLKKFCCER